MNNTTQMIYDRYTDSMNVNLIHHLKRQQQEPLLMYKTMDEVNRHGFCARIDSHLLAHLIPCPMAFAVHLF